MADNSFTLTATTTAPPDRVWKVLTDVDAAPRVFSGVDRVERLTEGPYRIGTRWRETRSVLGHEETQELTVTDAQALGSTRVEATGGSAPSTTTFDLVATHPGTKITVRFEGAAASEASETSTLKRLARTVTAPLGGRAARKAVQQDLDDIVAAAEGA